MAEPQQMEVEEEIQALSLAVRTSSRISKMRLGDWSYFRFQVLPFSWFFGILLAISWQACLKSYFSLTVEALKKERALHRAQAKTAAKQLKNLGKKNSKLMKALLLLLAT